MTSGTWNQIYGGAMLYLWLLQCALNGPENLIISQMPKAGFDVVFLKLHNYQAVFFLIDRRLLFLFEIGVIFLYAQGTS